MFVARCAVDLDGDEAGEAGTLGELTGFDVLRGHPEGTCLSPALLSPGIRPTAAHGTASRAGYGIRLYLPGRDGAWLRVDENPGALDVDAAETRWCAFAWPARRRTGAARTFRVDQTGRVTATHDRVDISQLGLVRTTDWVEVR